VERGWSVAKEHVTQHNSNKDYRLYFLNVNDEPGPALFHYSINEKKEHKLCDQWLF
jgi:hypothetical protein